LLEFLAPIVPFAAVARDLDEHDRIRQREVVSDVALFASANGGDVRIGIEPPDDDSDARIRRINRTRSAAQLSHQRRIDRACSGVPPAIAKTCPSKYSCLRLAYSSSLTYSWIV
jgi:hypothetical protein